MEYFDTNDTYTDTRCNPCRHTGANVGEFSFTIIAGSKWTKGYVLHASGLSAFFKGLTSRIHIADDLEWLSFPSCLSIFWIINNVFFKIYIKFNTVYLLYTNIPWRFVILHMRLTVELQANNLKTGQKKDNQSEGTRLEIHKLQLISYPSNMSLNLYFCVL